MQQRIFASEAPQHGLAKLQELLICSLPLGMAVEVLFTGRIFLTEILFACMLPFLLLKHVRALTQGKAAKVLFLGFLWLILQICTDMIRETAFEDFARGWSRIVFTLINFSCMYLLFYSRPKRIAFFAVTFALGEVGHLFLFPNDLITQDPWKYGFIGWAVTVLVLSILIAVKKVPVPLILLAAAAIAVLHFYMGFRSLGGLLFLSAGFAWFQRTRKKESALPTFSSYLKLAVVSLLVVVALSSAYSYAARSGFLGEEMRQKQGLQEGGSFGILVGGRAEMLASIPAIWDSPIIGHGSWARDSWYVGTMIDSLERNGYKLSEVEIAPDDQIPTHSHLFGAWVEAGIFGGIFWLYCLSFMLRGVPVVLRSSERYAVLFTFFALLAIWDILFSPLGAETRIYTPFYLASMLVLSQPAAAFASDVVRHRANPLFRSPIGARRV